MSEPKISVIIPMYNAERFIRQTLISVLASKFADYEVIVVDDCSTDNSVAEAEKLLPHFDGRLKIFSTQTNSGGAGVPRNIAIKNSAGKYVTFIDNDDMIVPSALADFYDVAEAFQADIVHTEKFLSFDNAGQQTFKREDLQLLRYETGECVEVPTFETNDLRGRIQRCIDGKFLIIPWGKLYRRDFLLENRIDFPQMRFAEDVTFCFKCLCLAEKYLRVPHVTNIHRIRTNSTGLVNITSREGVRLWLNIFVRNMIILEEFTSGLEFFEANPDVRNDVMRHYIRVHFDMIKNLFTTKQPHEVPKIFYDELQNPALDPKGKNIVAAYLFAERVLTKF